MESVLLHACCAPCSVKVVEELLKKGFDPTLFWFNQNIHPYTEFRARKIALEQFCASGGLNFVDGAGYDIKNFLLSLNGDFEFKTRCELCYFFRLKACAEFAKKNGFRIFSTTLLISPYQNHDQIKNLAFELAEKSGLKFLYFDFRPFFKQGQEKAKVLGLYMQKYCGCIFSEEERFCSKARRNLLKKLKQK